MISLLDVLRRDRDQIELKKIKVMGITSYKVAKILIRTATKNQKPNGKPPPHRNFNKTLNPKLTPPKNPPTKTKTPLIKIPNPLKKLQHSYFVSKPQ